MDEVYKASPNGLRDETDPKEIEKSQDQRNIENNANNLRNAANVAMKTKIPHAMVAGAIIKGADKLTGGRSSELVGKGINTMNKRVPIVGNKIQGLSNKISESGLSDAAGAATSLDKNEMVSKAASAAQKASGSSKDGKDKEGKGDSSLILKKKLKIKLLFIGIGAAIIFFFFMILFSILSGPNSGAMLDLTSNGGQSGNSINSTSAYSKAEVENLMVYMGDSRIVGMMSVITNQSITSIAEVGAGYYWLTNNAMSELENVIQNKKFIVLAFGVNDLGNSSNYVTKYQEIIDKYPNASVYIMSVNPVDETKQSTVTNASIESFNSVMSSTFGENYIDVYSQIKDDFVADDGLHYAPDTYRKIHDIVINYIQSKNIIPGSTSSYGYPTNTESEELKGQSLLEAIGQDGIDELESNIKSAVGTGCTGNAVARAAIALIDGLYAKGFHLPYYYGGGHVPKNPIVNPNWGANIGASVIKPSGTHDYYSGLDCSGFVMWSMHAANITGASDAKGFLSLGENIAFSKLSPGDVIANTGHVILVLENTGELLKTAESTGGGVQYRTYDYTQAQYYTGVSMSDYYANHCEV